MPVGDNRNGDDNDADMDGEGGLKIVAELARALDVHGLSAMLVSTGNGRFCTK